MYTFKHVWYEDDCSGNSSGIVVGITSTGMRLVVGVAMGCEEAVWTLTDARGEELGSGLVCLAAPWDGTYTMMPAFDRDSITLFVGIAAQDAWAPDRYLRNVEIN